MLRFDEGVSTFLGLTRAAEADAFPKGDIVRFCVDFRTTCLMLRGTLGIDDCLGGSSLASNETDARDRFDLPLLEVSAVGDWVICGRRCLLSVDVRLSSVRGFKQIRRDVFPGPNPRVAVQATNQIRAQ